MLLSRLLPVVAAAGMAGLTVGALPASAAPAAPQVVIKDGKTQPAFSYKDAVREKVYVETTVDSDHDGKRDRVSVYVTRPKETDGSLKVASIIEASPYFSGTQDPKYHPADVTDYPRLAPWDPPTGAWVPPDYGFSYYDNYFVSRGYAVLAADTLGTGDSDGCPTAVGRNEASGMKSVIEWLTGKAKAYDAKGNKVEANWSTKKVGMAGKSYDGTLPLATAGTRVDGLKTVVSISGVSNWYDEYRANGGVVAPDGWEGEDLDLHAKAVLTRKNLAVCAPVMHDLEKKMDRVTGDYNATWDERNFAKQAAHFKASVLEVGGLHDWNVKPIQFAGLWNGLKKAGVNRKLWIHQARHDEPIDIRKQVWLDTLDQWFAHELYGVNNDIMKQPKVDIERTPGTWETHGDWPEPSAHPVTFGLGGGAAAQQPGVLATARGKGTQGLVDAPARTAEELTAKPDSADPNRLIYLTPALKKNVRLSGTTKVKVRASVDGKSPYLTGLLVDYGTDTRFADFKPDGKPQWCYGDSIPGNEGCRTSRSYVTQSTPYEIVTRGWTDIRNRNSIWSQTPVKPGKDYTFSWPMQPYDHVFKAGHRIGLLILATDHAYTLRYPAGTKVQVQLGGSSLTLPITNG
ncbi:Xaa-Pro dipeptidyl-peptidase [Actinomadura barringtoniae]|uniref:Xaa-Pro dipeptidyl-peptidase n=1 Tax=Actinomadura barringtoniae TaxID=1427535 RepID=A0A939PFU7_9ACTN|nr:Xaa-Pro dipeptidyl-peptidase [Actinomadura barringtoniae]MBO2452082.1 Xaa-Pro dipeptidyl-peptidase [Actinomadura barringtoniae]